MCGITAISLAENSSIPDIRSFTRCAVMAIEHRGTDATGFGWTLPNGDGRYWKEPITAYRATMQAPLPKEATVMLGHTRWGTQGSKSVPANNHPVIDDGIMLVHNGMINNEFAIYKMFDMPVPRNTVDTAAIALLLANRDQLGADHPTDVLEIPTGSAAIAWIDTENPHALNLARLQDRPLTIAWTRKGDLVMSSTPETLDHLSLLSNIKFRKMLEFKEGSYLKVERGQIAEVKSFKPRTYSYSMGQSTGGGNNYVSKSSTQLEIVKNENKDAITVPFDQDDLKTYDICRWDVEDAEVPKEVEFSPVAIREWRYDCECSDCLLYEDMKEKWKAAEQADEQGLEEYVFDGQRWVWNHEAGDYVPMDMVEDTEDLSVLLLEDANVIADDDAILSALDR